MEVTYFFSVIIGFDKFAKIWVSLVVCELTSTLKRGLYAL